jgi:hypothetical protein
MADGQTVRLPISIASIPAPGVDQAHGAAQKTASESKADERPGTHMPILASHPTDATATARLCRFAPLAMSQAALALVLGHAAVYGLVHEADEGAAAHVFQLLMVLQLPLLVFHAVRIAPAAGRRGWQMVAAQVGVWLLAAAAAKVLT